MLEKITTDEDQSFYCRVEALKVLGMQGTLDHAVVRRLWNIAPRCFRPDLVAAAHFARGREAWCEPFVAGAMDDAVNTVVVRHLENGSGSP